MDRYARTTPRTNNEPHLMHAPQQHHHQQPDLADVVSRYVTVGSMSRNTSGVNRTPRQPSQEEDDRNGFARQLHDSQHGIAAVKAEIGIAHASRGGRPTVPNADEYTSPIVARAMRDHTPERKISFKKEQPISPRGSGAAASSGVDPVRLMEQSDDLHRTLSSKSMELTQLESSYSRDIDVFRTQAETEREENAGLLASVHKLRAQLHVKEQTKSEQEIEAQRALARKEEDCTRKMLHMRKSLLLSEQSVGSLRSENDTLAIKARELDLSKDEVGSLKMQLAQMSQSMTLLAQQNESLQRALQRKEGDAQSDLDVYVKQLDIIQSQASALKKENELLALRHRNQEALVDEIELLKRQNSDLQGAINRVDQEASEAQQRNATALQDKEDECAREVLNHRRQVMTLEKQVESLSLQNAHLTNKHRPQVITDEMNALTQQVKSLAEELSQKERQNEALQRAFARKEEEAHQDRTDASALVGDLQQRLNSMTGEWRTEKSRAERALLDTTHLKKQLDDNAQTSLKRETDLHERVRELQAQLDGAAHRANTQQNEAGTAKAVLAAEREQHRLAMEQMQAQHHEELRASLLRKEEQLTDSLSQSARQVELSNKLLSSTRTDNTALAQEVAKLTKQLLEMEHLKVEVERTKTLLQAKEEEIAEDAHTFNNQVDDYQQQLHEARRECSTLHSEIDSLKAQLQQQEATRNEEVDAEMRVLREKIIALNTEMIQEQKANSDKTDELKAQLATQQEQNAEIQRELDARASGQAGMREVELAVKNRSLTAENDQLKALIKQLCPEQFPELPALNKAGSGNALQSSPTPAMDIVHESGQASRTQSSQPLALGTTLTVPHQPGPINTTASYLQPSSSVVIVPDFSRPGSSTVVAQHTPVGIQSTEAERPNDLRSLSFRARSGSPGVIMRMDSMASGKADSLTAYNLQQPQQQQQQVTVYQGPPTPAHSVGTPRNVALVSEPLAVRSRTPIGAFSSDFESGVLPPVHQSSPLDPQLYGRAITYGEGQHNSARFDTLPRLFEQAVAVAGDTLALRTERRRGDIIEWDDVTWKQYYIRSFQFAKALLAEDVHPFHGVVLCASNSYEWATAFNGAVFAGAIPVACHQSWSTRHCFRIAQDCDAHLIVVDSNRTLQKFLTLKDQLPHVKHIVMFREAVPPGLKQLHNDYILTLEQFIARSNHASDEAVIARVENIAVENATSVVYTSGTVGEPRGVLLSHDNMQFAAYGIATTLMQDASGETSVSCSSLAEAHAQILDIVLPMMFVASRRGGFVVHFARSGSPISSVIRQVKPTFLFAKNLMLAEVAAALQAAPKSENDARLATWAKSIALEASTNRQNNIDTAPPKGLQMAQQLNERVRAAVGLDRCAFVVCVDGAVSRHTAEQLAQSGLDVLESYGQTETSGFATLSTPFRFKFGSAGSRLPGSEMKIESETRDRGRDGEILVRGRNVMIGYFGHSELTGRVIDREQWFHTGDLGRFDEAGLLTVTGRIKELITTLSGDRVPPAVIENEMKKQCPALSNVVVVGDRKKYAVALVTLKAKRDPETGNVTDELEGEALKVNPDVLTVTTARRDEKWLKYIASVVSNYNASALSQSHKVRRFCILSSDITQEEMTPTGKVRRSSVIDRCANIIDKLYAEESPRR